MKCVRAGIKGVSTCALPVPSASQVLLKIRSSGVNRPDILQNEGLYPARPGMSDVLGLEAAGVLVDEQGNETGEEVCALLPGGGYAEYCAVERDHCLSIPFSSNDRFDKSAALPEATFTVWKNLFWNGKDTLAGKRVFIHGGSSGIGSTAIALCKSFGATFIATTAGDDKKCEFSLQCGADAAFNYKEQKWWDYAKKYDVVLDMVGGDYLQKNLTLLDGDGRLVIVGFLGSPISEKVNMSRVLLKSLTVTGSVLRSAPNSVKSQLCENLQNHVWPRIYDGSLQLPHVSHVFNSLDKYQKAHELMREGSHLGKIVLRI